jgi:DNA-binding CsgD family transcriptional regulator
VGPLRVHAWVDHEPPDATRTDDVDAGRRPPPGPQPALDRLTARQLQVVVLLADGLRYRDIAHCLAISERQVQRHVRNAVAQLGVSSTAELAAVAVAMGVVPARDAGSPVVGEPPSPAASYCRAGLAPDAGMPEPAEDDEPDPSE